MTITDHIWADWPRDGQWYISPGVPWLAAGMPGACFCAGQRFRADDGFCVGHGFFVGDDFCVGAYFRAGNNFRAGNRFSAGDRVIVGRFCKVYDDACLGDDVHLGDGVRLGDYCTAVLDCGYEPQRGYRRYAAVERGVIYVYAGCHRFTLDVARRHWGSADYPHRNRGDSYLRWLDWVAAELDR